MEVNHLKDVIEALALQARAGYSLRQFAEEAPEWAKPAISEARKAGFITEVDGTAILTHKAKALFLAEIKG